MTAAPPSGAVVGVVLAGGRSTRMGTDKALLVLDGRPLVARLAGVLRAAGADPVWALGGDAVAIGAVGLDVLADRRPHLGPLVALTDAAPTLCAAAGADGVVVAVACDLAHLGPPTVGRLVDLLRSRPEAAAAVPVVDGVRQVHVLALRSAALAALARHPHPSGSVRRALDAVAVVELAGVDRAELHDLDRPEDVAEYARRRPERPRP